MTAQILASELANLVQDSKRKNSELKTAAEKSLQDLKSLAITSEAQLAADLSRRPNFISPFLIACGTHNAKLGATGVSCLQRLSVARALPRERLPEVLEALRDSVSLSNDIQLKILQALPSLLSNYPSEIRGDVLSVVLHICSALQNVKNFAVSNTAVATLQQLVITVYDRLATEDERALEIPTSAEVAVERGVVAVRPAAYDAYKVFHDLNLLVTGKKPVYIRFSSLPPTSTLELIEAILSNHGRIVAKHPEQIYILRSVLMPLIIDSLSDRLPFPITLRIIRILNLLIRNYLHIMPSECEIALGLLNHMLDPEASPLWKRALCLEVFRGIYSDSRLLFQIYSLFDGQEGKKCIFGDNLAAFVRLATEKPAIIGLGEESTDPVNHREIKGAVSEQAVAEADAIAGVIGGPVSESKANGHPVGLSTQWSQLKTPCIEHLDKNDPPALPETYVYSLVLTCITNVSETLAKFVQPLTVHQENKGRKRSKTDELSRSDSGKTRLTRSQSFRKKTIPVNPLSLTDHPDYSRIQTTANLVTECWPAVYTTCSTFLKAALDDDYYRQLVRAIQKFTQVAGLLRLSTPRDAFLTILGKSALPATLLFSNISSPKLSGSESPGVFSNAKGLLSVDSLVSQASRMSMDKIRRPSPEASTPTLRPRHLLCLRALLNLATALGTTLQSAWTIIFETLQVADFVMVMSNHPSGAHTPGPPGGRPEMDVSSEKVEAEFDAVQAAARRLFESTVDFPNDAFVELLRALCGLLNTEKNTESGQRTPTTSSRPKVLQQRRMGSVSGMSLNTDSHARDSVFALTKIRELAETNEVRLCQYDPTESGWDVFVAELVRFSKDDRKAASARLLAADILSSTVKEMAKISTGDELSNEIQKRILTALQTQISALLENGVDNSYGDTVMRIHQIALEALQSVIEQCGESLVAGWDAVFDSLLSVFSTETVSSTHSERIAESPDESHEESARLIKVISKPLARSAFGSVQLVCSDFLAVVPEGSLSTLLELLLRFCSQQEDFNMSLTTTTFFWNVSDFLRSRGDLSTLPDMLGGHEQLEDVGRTIKEKSHEGSMAALWLQVLLNLSTVTTDARAELRNSAVQTIQRIFENCSDQLSASTWMICLRTVMFGMVERNLAVHTSIREKSSTSADEIKAWNDTTKTVLGSVTVLFATYMENIDDTTGLGPAWCHLLDYFEKYFDCKSHALGCSVFTTITGVLSRPEAAEKLGAQALHKTAMLWKKYFDHRDDWAPGSQANQESFVAYAEAFKAIYRLCGKALDSGLPSMLFNLELCVKDSDAVAYSSDVDHMTPLQTQVMECLSMVDISSAGLATVLIKMLSELIRLPYEIDPRSAGPTFVALSKAAMSLLQLVIIHHRDDWDIYGSNAFDGAMKNLAEAIREKYIWQRDDKPPALWQKATTTALAILGPGLPNLNTHEQGGEQTKFQWTNSLVIIAMGITKAQIDPSNIPAFVEKDETFDIEAFGSLRNMMTECLGWSLYPDRLRRLYALHLFETSLIHTSTQGETPNHKTLETEPLKDPYKIRLGQTKEREPILRTEMAYMCYAELVSMVQVHDGSPDRARLAKAAAPYLILRAAVVLRAYVADQPLRGRMPAPESQRRELLFTLKALEDLKSEPQAIPDAPGVASDHRKHLHRLYPLIIKAMGVARQDAEVFEHLLSLSDRVGDEFGLEDE